MKDKYNFKFKESIHTGNIYSFDDRMDITVTISCDYCETCEEANDVDENNAMYELGKILEKKGWAIVADADDEELIFCSECLKYLKDNDKID